MRLLLFASSIERSATSFLVTETYRLIPQFCTSRVTSTAIGALEGFRALPAQMMKSERISPYSGQATETKKITNTVFWGSNGLLEMFGRPFVIGIISLVREKATLESSKNGTPITNETQRYVTPGQNLSSRLC